jgi:outer membrane protein TolC
MDDKDKEQRSSSIALSQTALTIVTALVAGVVMLLAGCASPQGIAPTKQLQTSAADSANATPWPAADWWQAYGDKPLDALVQQAIAGQPGLRIAQARLRQAQAAVDASNAARGPQVNGSL